MISMNDFKHIIQLRNEGLTQEQIAKRLNLSRRTVIRYLKSGKIPDYSRSNNKPAKSPFNDFEALAAKKIKETPQIPLNDLYEYLCLNGYDGSERTLRRRTRELRHSLKKNKEVFFKREYRPGEVAEGDFTEFTIKIGGKSRRVYLWVTSLPYSNYYFATPFYHCDFESFAQGTVDAFTEFGGVPHSYRLDNMSPVVKKVLTGKDRKITSRFAELQNHYQFKQDFCNPGKGNEKGNVEANNKHLKNKIKANISLNNLLFKNLDSFKEFVWKLCRQHNQSQKVKEKFADESLKQLPQQPFRAFRSTVVKISKYSLFSLESTGHMYSVPSKFIGLSLECRVYPDKLEILHESELIASHNRIYGPKGLVSIEVTHIIDELIKKPGAVRDWKYKHILFERPVWKRFYEKILKDKDYLKCLKLIKKYGKETVTVAMELCLEEESNPSVQNLKKIITNEMENIFEMAPLDVNLNHFDELIKRRENGS